MFKVLKNVGLLLLVVMALVGMWFSVPLISLKVLVTCFVVAEVVVLVVCHYNDDLYSWIWTFVLLAIVIIFALWLFCPIVWLNIIISIVEIVWIIVLMLMNYVPDFFTVQ